MKDSSLPFQTFVNLFSFTCILASGSLIVYCTWQYCKNEDFSVVRFAEYNHRKNDIYPGITLCLRDDYIKESTFSPFEQKMYKSFIGGRKILKSDREKRAYLDRRSNRKPNPIANRPKSITADEEEIISNFTSKLEHIYINNDVKNINDFLSFGTMATYRSGWSAYHYATNKSFQKEKWVSNYYLSFSPSHKRCWTFEPPIKSNDIMLSYSVMFNKSIFYGRWRPPYKRFEIRLSYPGQQLTSPARKYDWGKNESKNDYTMKFEIQNIVVMKRRNKLTANCEENWKQNDNILIEKMASDFKCLLPHWSLNSTYPLCLGQQIPRIAMKFGQIRNSKPPCQAIEKILYTYEEIAGLENFVGYFGCPSDKCILEKMKRERINFNHSDIIQVMITFQGGTYMEITQTRAYDGQSLIGNAGGYVGLFLGVALIQLPTAFKNIFQMLKK